MKNLFIGLGAAVLAIVLLMGGCKALNTHIYACQDCERFNIDNIELRTGLNIPSVTAVECNYENNIKMAKFLLDVDKFDLSEYISKNELSLEDDMYFKRGEREDTKWLVALDAETAELFVTINYK